jgi:hypothetical protein
VIIDFNVNCTLVLLFSDDLQNVLLLSKSSGILDGFFIIENDKEISAVFVTKAINPVLKEKIEPHNLRIVTTLQNIEKKWKIDVYMISVKQDDVILNQDMRWVPIDKLDNTCLPNLKWLIPLSIDSTVYGSSFNQILMK